MSKLSQSEIDAAVAKSLNTLDPAEEQVEGIRPYKSLIGIQNIKGNRYRHRIVKKLVAPYIKLHRKLYEGYYEQQTRVDSYVMQEIGLLHQRIDDLPVVLSLDKKFDASTFETQKLIDKFKKEILFELVELKGGSAAHSEYVKPETKIINAPRVNSLKKVNIGCGTDVRDDYINVDHRAIEGVDVVADVLDLPFKPGSLKEIFASHVAEHFIQKDLAKVLQYWYGLLDKGGAIRLIVPNIEDMAKRYTRGELTWEEFRSVALGGQDYASDYHFNHFSVASMKDLVRATLPEAKFEIVSPSRRNGECFEMEVLIKK